MAEFDLVVRGADVVLPDAVQRLDIGVTDGLVADVGAGACSWSRGG